MTVPGWLGAQLDAVPEYSRFDDPDGIRDAMAAVAADHPEVAVLTRCGTSRQGEPIHVLTVGDRDAPHDALVYGLPHPNEPIGGLTVPLLGRRIAEDEDLRRRLGHRWHLVGCADPDGLRLNAGWLAGPFTREHYARHFYRPAGGAQVEWTFPLHHREAHFDAVMPETQALVRLIDEHRPGFVSALHNGELGGAYAYLSEDRPALRRLLAAVPGALGIPLDLGEPESPELVHAGDAVFVLPAFEEVYAAATADGSPWQQRGGSTPTYASRWGALTLIGELPYWHDPRAADTAPSGLAYRDRLLALAGAVGELGELLQEALASTAAHRLAPGSPLWEASDFFGPLMAAEAEALAARAATPEADREATVAEAAGLEARAHMFRLRFTGVLLRALDAEHAAGNTSEPVRRARARVRAAFEAWIAEDAAALPLDPIPIRSLVAAQLGCVLAAAADVAGAR